MRNKLVFLLVAFRLLGATSLAFGQSYPTVYDMVRDAKPHTNPDGVWSYGWSTNVGSFFRLFTNDGLNGNGVDVYTDGLPYPDATYCKINFLTNLVTYPTQTAETNTIYLDPQSYAAMVRFTVPTNGYYAINGFFETQDSNTVAHNALILIDSSITNYFITTTNGRNFLKYPFNLNVMLQRDETVDFINANLNNSNSLTTGVAGTVTLLPAVVLQLSWNSVSNVTYQIQTNSDLLQNSWRNYGAPITATGTNITIPAPVTNRNLFFRVSY